MPDAATMRAARPKCPKKKPGSKDRCARPLQTRGRSYFCPIHGVTRRT